jgi:hypothetical protein
MCNRIAWSALNFPAIPRFEEKVRDIVGLYLNPPDRALVLGVSRQSKKYTSSWTTTAPIKAPRCNVG